MEFEAVVKQRTERFRDEELHVLVEEILNPNNKLSRSVPNKERRKAWRDMLRRVNSVSRSKRTLLQLKKRYYDVKRQRGSNIKQLYNRVVVRLTGGDLYSNIKQEPMEISLEQLDPQHDSKLNGLLMPCVPMLKLEDIVMHFSKAPLYCMELENLAENDPSHSNNQTTVPSDAQNCTGDTQNSTGDTHASTGDTQDSTGDAQDSACHSETPDSPTTSSVQDQPSPLVVVEEISAEIKRMNTACSAMLASTAQIASTIKELATVIGTLNYQRRYFGERMLQSMENISVIMKERRKYQ
ncbi:uncharacterized protein LOC103034729 [Astyanax mexicanus]|uniref:uncharacterized protein LOC103034729 n=1 Tax=Astyanax mexicanus TaxID=7994 RepID=UPI000440B5EB|nr:uncharacterized protein LOC103034729 [Astyanax mexicanus]